MGIKAIYINDNVSSIQEQHNSIRVSISEVWSKLDSAHKKVSDLLTFKQFKKTMNKPLTHELLLSITKNKKVFEQMEIIEWCREKLKELEPLEENLYTKLHSKPKLTLIKGK